VKLPNYRAAKLTTKPVTQKTALWLFLLISILTVFAYVPGLTGDYMFDDMPNLLENRRLDIESLDIESLHGATLSSGSGLLRRPISMASFVLNRHFFGISPYSHKVVNLIIHLLNGFGLFLLSQLLMRSYRPRFAPELSEKTMILMPVIVSGLWLLHPLNLTPVLYIVQRMTSLATLFTVFGLCLYVIGRQRMLIEKRGLLLILTGLFLFGGLAVLSKESGVLISLYALVIELTLFQFRNSSNQLEKTIIGLFVLTVAAPTCLALIYQAFNLDSFLNGYSTRDFTLVERILTEGRVLIFYIKMIIMPSITELGLYHDDITLSQGLLDPPATLYSLITLAALALTAFTMIRKRPLISLGILWFFTGHVLESTIIPLEITHEHRNYLADYGIILAITSAITQAPLRKLAPTINIIAPVIFLLLLLPMGASSQVQRSSMTLGVSDSVNVVRLGFERLLNTFTGTGDAAVRGQDGSLRYDIRQQVRSRLVRVPGSPRQDEYKGSVLMVAPLAQGLDAHVLEESSVLGGSRGAGGPSRCRIRGPGAFVGKTRSEKSTVTGS